jgi:hypothetical protein
MRNRNTAITAIVSVAFLVSVWILLPPSTTLPAPSAPPSETLTQGINNSEWIIRATIFAGIVVISLAFLFLFLVAVFRSMRIKKNYANGEKKKFPTYLVLKILIVVTVILFGWFLFPYLPYQQIKDFFKDCWEKIVGWTGLGPIWTALILVVILAIAFMFYRERNRLGTFRLPRYLKTILGIAVAIGLIHLFIWLFWPKEWTGWTKSWELFWVSNVGLLLVIFLWLSEIRFGKTLAFLLAIVITVGVFSHLSAEKKNQLRNLVSREPGNEVSKQVLVRPKKQTGTIYWLPLDPQFANADLGNTHPGDEDKAINITNNEDVLELTSVSRRSDRKLLWKWDKNSQRGFWRDPTDKRMGGLYIHPEENLQTGKVPNQFEGVWYGSKTGLPRPFLLVMDR